MVKTHIDASLGSALLWHRAEVMLKVNRPDGRTVDIYSTVPLADFEPTARYVPPTTFVGSSSGPCAYVAPLVVPSAPRPTCHALSVALARV